MDLSLLLLSFCFLFFFFLPGSRRVFERICSVQVENSNSLEVTHRSLGVM